MKIALAVVGGIVLTVLVGGGGFTAWMVLTFMHDSPKTADTAMLAFALLALGGLAMLATIWLGVMAVIVEPWRRGLLIASAFSASGALASVVGAFALPMLA